MSIYETLQQQICTDPDSAAYSILSNNKRLVLANVVGTKERMVLEIPFNEKIDEVLLRDAQAAILWAEALTRFVIGMQAQVQCRLITTSMHNLSNSLKAQLYSTLETKTKYAMYPAVRRSYISGLDNYVDGVMDISGSLDHVLEYSEQWVTSHAEMELSRRALESEISDLFLYCNTINWPNNTLSYSPWIPIYDDVTFGITSMSHLDEIDRDIDANKLEADTLLANLTAEAVMLESQDQTTEPQTGSAEAPEVPGVVEVDAARDEAPTFLSMDYFFNQKKKFFNQKKK